MAKTKTKKPFNFPEIQNKYLKNEVQPHEVCIIGDRLLTDIVMAHKNGLVGILVKPIDPSSENWGIRIMRFFENI